MAVYGYARISTPKQNIDRQVRNIIAVHPDAIIVKEVFTGTKFQGRKELDNKILKRIREGDTIVFDAVSRMARNADEGWELYKELYEKNINLEFIKQPHVNTKTYKEAMQNQISMTGDDVDLILEGVNKYLLKVAEKQIRLAFEQAEKEVKDIHQRTKEGMLTARLNGKQIGQVKGVQLTVKKKNPAKEKIKKYNNTFGGPLNNEETWTLAGISKKTFYKYKKEIEEEMLVKHE